MERFEIIRRIEKALIKGNLTKSEIKRKTKLSDRQIRTATNNMFKTKQLIKIPNLDDMRSHYYQLIE